MNTEKTEKNFNNKELLNPEVIIRYLTFYKFFIVSVIFFLLTAFFYLRYADFKYESNARIEVIDDAMDSEMALPTAMTIFNRSMINLENEIGVLSSTKLHKLVAKKLNSNIEFFTIGNIKNTQNHLSEWFDDYDINFTIDTDTITEAVKFELSFDNNALKISEFNKSNDFVKSYDFNGYSTKNTNHDLPFDIDVRDDKSRIEGIKKSIIIKPFDFVVDWFLNNVKVSETAKDSDQLNLSLRLSNPKIANQYLNALIFEFDNDGILDRRLVYKRTIDFVDSRFDLLNEQLETIELRKKEFKEINNLLNIELDAQLNINQKSIYNSEIFKANAQLELSKFLIRTLKENEFDYLPVNIGIENENINSLIAAHNLILREKDRFLITAGENNYTINNYNKQITNSNQNIIQSLSLYVENLNIKISNLASKEMEFENLYKNMPENEKILRSINRELEIKESLFLLLLQKREEAAINFAVIKPSIKIIDSAKNSYYPVYPVPMLVYLGSFLLGVFVPVLILFIKFSFDTRIHTREHLTKYIPDIPILAEIPHIKNIKSISNTFSERSLIDEAFRMMVANIRFLLLDKNKLSGDSFVVTSSIKGEGKTIISFNLAKTLAAGQNKKVILVGSDLRNPQIHSILGIDKNRKGLSDFLFQSKKSRIEDYVFTHDINNVSFDILMSGTIPPNPSSLISSSQFKDLINDLKSKYDHVIIDSAPCLLVSDTFSLSDLVDCTIYAVRSNLTTIKLAEFINECNNENKLKNMSLVLNCVGSSQGYGYKYGYQYGYNYGYKYSYNYGYTFKEEDK